MSGVQRTGGVATWHDLFERVQYDYTMLRDCEGGRTAVVERGDVYLPKPPALQLMGNDVDGRKYKWLLSHAEFPSIVTDGLKRMQGIAHQAPPKVELPAAMEYLLERATPDGKSLHELYMEVTREVFLMGSCGLLPEVYTTGDRVYLCRYAAERIINWRMQRDPDAIRLLFLVLHEPHDEPTEDGFGTTRVDYYRVLRHTPAGYAQELWRHDRKTETGPYVEREPVIPSRKGKAWQEIPFVRINADDLEIEPGDRPLLPVAYKAMDVYRKSAGFHRAIYNKEDPPLMRVGISPQEAETMNTIGGSAVWDAGNPDAKGSYIEMSGDMLELAFKVMEGDLKEGRDVIGKLIDDSKGGVESGEALRERRASNAITLASMMRTIGLGMRKALQQVAIAVGANPDEVVFEPSLDFLASTMTPKDALDLITAKNSGFPISLAAIHEKARQGGLTTMTFEDEMESIEEEDPTGLLSSHQGNEAQSGDDPVDDPDDEQAAA